jgi:tripartite-type tricarboxylate transporter receptor subunit TctC
VTLSTHLALAPPKLPKEIRDTILKAFEKAANSEDYKDFLVKNNGVPSYMTPEATTKWMNDQRDVYRELFREVGLLKEK